jgi:PIN domain nuclease of toxin-antitoxin system
MRAILDTCTCVWFYSAPGQVSAKVLARITDPATVLYLSVVSVWEVLIKQRTGRADAPTGDFLRIVDEHVRAGVVAMLPVTLLHVAEVPTLAVHHRDPFDRMLICQAQAEGLSLLSPDPLVRQYPVAWEW